jgi:hypothetical protein
MTEILKPCMARDLKKKKSTVDNEPGFFSNQLKLKPWNGVQSSS